MKKLLLSGLLISVLAGVVGCASDEPPRTSTSTTTTTTEETVVHPANTSPHN